jgi:hypothetical protein
MKKILLLMMCCPAMLAAQNSNGVTLSNLMVNAGTVTFNVSWRNTSMPTLWSDSVWVFVDYNKNGVMTRLPVASATATAGTVTKVQGNDKGVWVIGNARTAGSFSATVQLFTDITDVAGACAYASNYPPVGKYTSATEVEFTGTPMYNIVLKHMSGGTITRKSDSQFSVPESYTVQSFTDATGAPGTIPPVLVGPPLAATNLTYKFGSSTLTWSDLIAYIPTNCTNLPSGTSASSNVMRYSARTKNGTLIYYYTRDCLASNRTDICPDPWRIPSQAEVATIDVEWSARPLPTLRSTGDITWHHDETTNEGIFMWASGKDGAAAVGWIFLEPSDRRTFSAPSGSLTPARCVY